ncbi:MAG: hypothetical protein JWM85_2497 [Acidimicrobiaceae bacterium]|nr:hypothetical protein [Acidimicrobiaceae bacterium]
MQRILDLDLDVDVVLGDAAILRGPDDGRLDGADFPPGLPEQVLAFLHDPMPTWRATTGIRRREPRRAVLALARGDRRRAAQRAVPRDRGGSSPSAIVDVGAQPSCHYHG